MHDLATLLLEASRADLLADVHRRVCLIKGPTCPSCTYHADRVKSADRTLHDTLASRKAA
jgi:hydrogenase maturation factor